MAINKGQVRITHEKIGDMYIFKAKLVVDNENAIPARTIVGIPKAARDEFVFGVEHTLAMSIIAHIYGDLIEPINELATLAEFHVTSNDDKEEIKEIRQRLADILLGKIPEVKDEGVIITGN